ncbi:hypothetical protein T440DRAFT_463860 [Plenodomus tracheiphilus IPT5]|uniref:Restriction of telomere capping protein 4 n=1 Tax=Plenodomus tracheiphilus IPT5 TaxID=1408161 RepID=A0A6A7BJP0_9PLEO|nr:hypothetical protein T440DRAFT_463860 [Plenodomus tracheiphilus IPT5]
MGLLSRNGAPSLLRTVRGKMHASDKDHEEPAQKKRKTENRQLTKKDEAALYAEPQSSGDEELRKPSQKPKVSKPGLSKKMLTKEEEDAIYAEPMSSEDEQLRKPSPRKPKPSKPPLLPQSSQEDTELKKPTRESVRRVTEIKKPVPGSYAQGKADKARQAAAPNKENDSSAAPSSSAASVTDGAYAWGMEHSSQRSSQNARSYGSKRKTTNIHAPPQKKTFGKPKGISKPSSAGGHSWSKKVPSAKDEDDSLSDVSLKDPLELTPEELDAILASDVEGTEDPALRRVDCKPKHKASYKGLSKTAGIDKTFSDGLALPSVKSKKKKMTSTGGTSNSTMLDEDELEEILKHSRVCDQLDDWINNQSVLSSQPDSSAPQEALDSLHDYIQQLPGQDVEGTQCTLCKEPIEIEDYWDFWKGKDKTVKNHTAFCHAHKKKSAQDEYKREGYPTINWDTLPTRIRKHRMSLFQILTNDRPSTYRTRYEPLALTGKAAAVPSRRNDLPSTIQDELDSYAVDDQSTYPGYYGPHGRRAITEHVMKVLKNEIKICKDAVVQGSGPAAFVQAVLVPEMAVMLIMEDCEVDRERAEEIREATCEMGVLLNEEIEDEVEGDDGEGSDDENEYLYR